MAAHPPTQWVLYNAAHAESAIRSVDGDAWLRVLGVFGSREAAQRHTRELAAHDRGIEIRVAPLGEFRMLLRSRYNDAGGVMDMVTRTREAAKHAALLDEHAKRRRAAAEQTAANAMARKMGELAFTPADRMAAYAEELGAAAPSTPITPAPARASEPVGGAGAAPLPASAAEGSGEGSSISISNISSPAVRAVPPHLEVRMQKFMALAVVPDYEHQAHLDARLRVWEDARDRAFACVRNMALAAAVRPGDLLPTPRDLLREWVCANPPPAGYNVWGQRTASAASGGGGGGGDEDAEAALAQHNVWARIPDVEPDAENTEAAGWCRAFKVQYEAALWPALGIAPPDRGTALREWMASNPMPNSTAGAEPAVACLFAGDTEDEVRAWIERESSTPRLRDFDIGCVAMYEWIKVANAWSERVRTTYREPVLAKLHANKEAQRREAAALADAGVKITEVNGGAAVALLAGGTST